MILANKDRTKSSVRFFATDQQADEYLHAIECLRFRSQFLSLDKLHKLWGIKTLDRTVEVVLRMEVKNALLLRHMLQLEWDTYIESCMVPVETREREDPTRTVYRPNPRPAEMLWHTEPPVDAAIKSFLETHDLLLSLPHGCREKLRHQVEHVDTMWIDRNTRSQPPTILESVKIRMRRTKGERLRIREKKLFYVTNEILHYDGDLLKEAHHGREMTFAPVKASIIPGLATVADLPTISEKDSLVHNISRAKARLTAPMILRPNLVRKIGRSLFEEELIDFFKSDRNIKARLLGRSVTAISPPHRNARGQKRETGVDHTEDYPVS